MVEPRIGRRRQRRLGVVGDAQPRRAAPCRGRWRRRPTASTSAAAIPPPPASRRSAASLASRPRIGRATSPVSRPSRDQQRVRLIAGEPRRRGDPLGEEAEAAGDQRRLRPERRHRPHQRPRAGIEPHPLGIAALEDRCRQPLEQRHPRDQRRLEVELAPHRRLGDRAPPRGLSPAKSASSSMHSTPMIVESMSAISSRLRRPSAGTTLASHPGSREARPAAARRRRSRPRSSASRRGASRSSRAGRGRVGDAGRRGQDQDAAGHFGRPTSDRGAPRLQALVQHLGDEEGELQRLRRVQPRVAGGVVAVRQVLVGHRPHAAGAFGHVLRRSSRNARRRGWCPRRAWTAKNSRTSRSTRSKGRVL